MYFADTGRIVFGRVADYILVNHAQGIFEELKRSFTFKMTYEDRILKFEGSVDFNGFFRKTKSVNDE